MKKKLCIILMLVIIMNMVVPVFAEQSTSTDNIKVYVNDTKISFDVSPIFVKSRTMVPIRAVFESIGANVKWDNFTKTVSITRGAEVRVQINNRMAMVNNEPYFMDVPAVGVDGRILVPVRFIGEALGANVDWVNDTKTVFINDLTVQKELSNIQNWGKFAVDDTYYYHILPDGVLVRENIINRQKEKLSDRIVCDIHIVDEWLYCIGIDKGVQKVIRLKKDGSEKEVIIDKPVTAMQIINGWAYYSDFDKKTSLFRSKIDGTESSVIFDNGDFSDKNWFVQNGWIYFCNNQNNTISRIRIDGSDITNITSKHISSNSTKNNIYDLKLIDKEYLYAVINEDINSVKYTPGLYRVPVDGGELTKISDNIPVSANMDDEWLYLSVENTENTYKLIKCKKDGTGVLTLNEYKENDVLKNIYLHNSSIFYTLIRGESSSGEILFHMNSNGQNIESYSWVYGKNYYIVRDILSNTASAHKTLNSFSSVQTSSSESEQGTTKTIEEYTYNRSRSIFYQKTLLDENQEIELWLDNNNLYSKRPDELQWSITQISESQSDDLQKSIFDFILPYEEFCNNLNLEETNDQYILTGTGQFLVFINNIFANPSITYDLTDIDSVNLEIRINKRNKYIEELIIKMKYNSDITENGESKQFTNQYHYVNSLFNSVYLNMPYSIKQSIMAKDEATNSMENGLQKSQEGKYEEAIQLFDTAIGLYNKAYDAYLYKGNAQYNLGKYKEAVLTYNQYHELNPSDIEVVALKGMCYLKMGDLANAEMLGKEVLNNNHNSVLAYDLLGSVALLKENYRDSVKYYQSAVSLDKNHYKSHMNLVTALFSMGSYTKCIETIDKAIKLFPNDRELLYLRARCLSEQGKSLDAVQIYKKILEKNPSNDFVTMTYMAMEYENLQDYQKAKEYADRAQAIYPDYSLLKYLIDSLNYDFSTTSAQKLVDFIKENYLYYDTSEEIDKSFDEVIEKENNYTIEDVNKLIEAVKNIDDEYTYMISGYEYEYYMNGAKDYAMEATHEDDTIIVKIKSFSNGTGVKFAEYMNNIENPEEKSLIIDLRDNESGLSAEANKILDALLPDCTSSYIIERDGYINTYSSDKWHSSFSKIGILVNENTASSSELLALGLKNFSSNVTIIGRKTAGCGVGQIVYLDRSKRYAIFLVNHYWNVLHENVHGTGIDVDVYVDENDPDYTKAIKTFLE